MASRRILAGFAILFTLLFINYVHASSGAVYVLNVDGIIDPVTSGYIARGIREAEMHSAEALVIQMDTPGGLDTAMRSIIKDIFEADVPVVVYVHPSGARAASAGSFILMASHIAAMTPGTNVGAAHPVALGIGEVGAVSEKVVNDAAAYMKSIAEKRERNMYLAQSFVYNSTSITASEAKEGAIIEIIAEDYDSLLDELEGLEVKTKSGRQVLHTRRVKITSLPMSSTERFLHTISNPNVAYILFLAGIYGIIFELSNPGSLLPGVIGGIFILLALWSFQALSISATGLALVLFAVILFIAEVYTPTMGILTAGGIISLILGSLMLINAEKEPYVRISLSVIISTALFTALFFIFAVGLTLRTQKRKPTTGTKGMIGLKGITKTDLDPEGSVFVHGEFWKARTMKGKISKGKKIKVVGMDELILVVEEI